MDQKAQAPHASPAPDAPPKPVLDYPFEAPPQRGQTLEVAPGVLWIRMPLPYALDHINLWAIDDGNGWAIVDTGARTDEGVATWRELFSKSSDGRSLTRVLVTHMHPDHVGLAGWLTRKFHVPLYMTRLEYLNCRVVVSDCSREAPPDAIAFYRRAGWSDGALESYRARFGNFGKHIHALPDSYRRLHDGEELLISGDQVLPRISSNVSVHPMEPDANPMADWMESLEKVRREVPDDVLVLPAHGDCFRGLHARIDSLVAGQERANDRLLAALAEPRRAVDVFGALFSRPISESSPALLGMATGESLACLNHLMHAGLAERSIDGEGIAWYRAIPDQAGTACAGAGNWG
jgi:glyoxylase-like metal-dependent hydrolase (beta-lactamase superfamily II)